MIHKRPYYTDKIMEASGLVPIVLLIGSRQVGKTTILQNLPLEKDKLYLDGQDIDVATLFTSKSLIEEYLKINMNEELDGYLLLDEFQYINGVSTILKLLADHNNKLKIICSGSSSINIIQEVEESLAGRLRIIEVFSLSFSEYVLFKSDDLYQKYLKYDISTDAKIIDKDFYFMLYDFLIYGGMPRVALQKDHDIKIDLLDDIYRTYLLRDVRSFVKNQDFVGFNKLLRVLSVQIGNMVNINNLSKNTGLSYNATEEYLHLLEQMYIVRLVEPYYTNKKKVITKMKKVYFTDTGLRNIIYNDFRAPDDRLDNGAIFENFIYLEMFRKIRKSHKIYYYRTIDGSEVDFVIDTMRKLISIEAKFSDFDSPKFFKNLIALNNSENINQSFIFNKNLNLSHDNVSYFPAVLIDKFAL